MNGNGRIMNGHGRNSRPTNGRALKVRA